MMGTKERHFAPLISSDRFRYIADRDVYLCPAGKELHFAPWHSTERSLRYQAYGSDCNRCPRKRAVYHRQASGLLTARNR